MKNVIFIDIDSTLILRDQTIPKSAVKAVKATKEKGNDIFIATGRAINEINPEIFELEFDGYITAGGSDVLFGKKRIKEERFVRSEVERILTFLSENAISFYLVTRLGLYSTKESADKIMQIWNKNEEKMGVEKYSEGFHDALTVNNFEDISYDEIKKIAFISDTVDFNIVHDYFSNDYTVLHKTVNELGEQSGEIILKNGDKGAAVKKVLSMYHEPVKSFAFGDGSNDKAMFKAVDFGVRMYDSHSDLISISHDIAPPIEEDGIFRSFKKNKLI